MSGPKQNDNPGKMTLKNTIKPFGGKGGAIRKTSKKPPQKI